MSDVSAPLAISDDTLGRAVAQGVLTTQQADLLRYLERTRSSTSVPMSQDDERFRFINGFGDIFVTIGLGLFLGALTYFSVSMLGTAGSGIVIAVACWLLAEYFTRKARMSLPSIVLLLAFAAAIFVAVEAVLHPGGSGIGLHAGWQTIVAGFVTAGAAAIHYKRFHVPVTIAAGVGALTASVIAIFFVAAPDLAQRAVRPLLFLCGLAVFALAMRFDLSDPKRQTRRTDIAFWLHMLAGPLIVHSLVGGLGDIGSLDVASAVAILAIFAGLALLALVVDRRAMLVSGLSYAGFAFGTLIVKAGLGNGAVPMTLLVLGALVLLLSAGWHTLRRLLLPLFPGALVRRLPPHT